MYNIAKAHTFLPDQEWKTFEMNTSIPVRRFPSTKKIVGVEPELISITPQKSQIDPSELQQVTRFFSYASLVSMAAFICFVVASVSFKGASMLAVLSSVFLFAWVIFGFCYTKIRAVVL